MFNEDVPAQSKGARQSGEPTKDQIEYIADLVLELKEMARRYKLLTLEGILDVAYKEARLRSRDLD
ncbi:MAG: hypothetical protein AB7S70_15295 [Hyphomicrobium sp.]|uniref:hypothetical protein n=1 Tax=Hyphomicrobium sp. TaxID=82 RepID=UPI003D143EEF